MVVPGVSVRSQQGVKFVHGNINLPSWRAEMNTHFSQVIDEAQWASCLHILSHFVKKLIDSEQL